MLTTHINHPDVEEFAKIKQDLTKVTGANISIKLTKEFLEAVEKDEDYILRFPVDVELTKDTLNALKEVPYNHLKRNIDEKTGKSHGYFKKVKAKELWNTIVKCARNTAEPGLAFYDRIIDYSPDGVYDNFKPTGCNPCGEVIASKKLCKFGEA